MKNVQRPTANVQLSMGRGPGYHWMFKVACWLLNVPSSVLIFTIHLYRWAFSPVLVFLFGPGGGCRFTPSCSQYAVEAIRSQGALTGAWLAVKRICRCHPWGGCGPEPAPEKKFGIRNSEPGI